MDYFLILCFDDDTEKRFNALIQAIVQNGVNSYMTKIPPHVTVSSFYADRPDTVRDAVDAKRSLFSTGDIFWASLGAFTPHTLFAAPVLNEYLQDFCVSMNGLISPLAEAGDYGHYLPYQWFPHTTLAAKLGEGELNKAFETAVRQFTPFGGRSNRLILAEGNPYKEIEVWDLD